MRNKKTLGDNRGFLPQAQWPLLFLNNQEKSLKNKNENTKGKIVREKKKKHVQSYPMVEEAHIIEIIHIYMSPPGQFLDSKTIA